MADEVLFVAERNYECSIRKFYNSQPCKMLGARSTIEICTMTYITEHMLHIIIDCSDTASPLHWSYLNMELAEMTKHVRV